MYDTKIVRSFGTSKIPTKECFITLTKRLLLFQIGDVETEVAALTSELESERRSLDVKNRELTFVRKKINEFDAKIRDINGKKFAFSDLVREIDQSQENLQSLSIVDRSTQIKEFEKKLNFLRTSELPSAIEEDDHLASEAADLTLKQMELDLKLGQLQVRVDFVMKLP